MELIVLILIVLVVLLPIWLIARAVSAGQQLDDLTRRLGQAELWDNVHLRTPQSIPPERLTHPTLVFHPQRPIFHAL